MLQLPCHIPARHLPGIVKVWLALAGLSVILPALSQSPLEKRTRQNLSVNRVKSQVSWDYVYKGNKPSDQGIKTSVTEYTAQGDVAEVTSFNPKGQALNLEKYRYDPRGNKTEYSRYTGTDQKQAAYQKLSKYDESNLLVEESGYDGVEDFLNQYRYDDQGELAEIRYMKEKVLLEKRIFGRKGSTTTVSIYNQGGNLVSRLVLKYDEARNLTEETVYGLNESELEKKIYSYDKNRKLTGETKFRLDKVTLKTTYTYNPSGDLSEVGEENPGSSRFVKKSYIYDQKGNLLEIRWRRKGNEEFNSISYTYDARGLCQTAETWYPATQYRVLTRYKYEFF